ncbi:hypothetical protein CEXT_624161 [Caerostris extrusa]|uniref:Cytochrome P450 n=1 Tax=Caerostris extrusa TaxID=172846 RepID=A0AAV4P811_CAEEX|nr:hypothetical protein CEXT_624161 [Caerostris extrusa]
MVVAFDLFSTSSRTKIGAYDIPEDTIVMPNLWGVHHDAEYWENPFAFRPERFLKDGRAVRPRAFVPFSCGKNRICQRKSGSSAQCLRDGGKKREFFLNR